MKRSKKHRKIERKVRLAREFSVNLGIPNVEMFAGFPIKKGAINNLWDWNTLEQVKL